MALQGAKDADAMARMAFEERIFDSSYCENASLFPSASRTYISRAPPRLACRLHVDMHSIGRELSSAARR